MGHRPKVAAGGFTLVEVILALFILGLVIGLSIPLAGRAADGIRARADVAGFSAILRHAREQAITTQRPHVVHVEPADRRMTIVAGEADVRASRSFAERLTVEAPTGSALTVRFEPYGVSTGGEFRLRSGAVVYRVSVDALTGRVRVERE
jgi:prepilin-type N-terminal cleavage/methylation domain-containing protein